MASVKSLGIYEASGLHYLVAEGILPPDPPESLYTWKTSLFWDVKRGQNVEEELLITDTCVVWSISRVVQRVYNLDVEGEPILNAFTTSFVVGHKDRDDFENIPAGAACHRDTVEAFERGLVVVLRSQAHIFLVSGTSYVLPLPFEAGCAFPSPRGFFLQSNTNVDAGDEFLGRPAIDSFSIRDRENLSSKFKANVSRPSLVLPAEENLPWARGVKSQGLPPRTLYFTKILSEMGVVVMAKPTTASGTFSSAGEDLQPLSVDESIIFVSSADDIKQNQMSFTAPSCLVVTHNQKESRLTIWQANFLDLDVGDVSQVRFQNDNSLLSWKRKSSNMHGRIPGTATPVLYNGRPRESFGALTQSYSDTFPDQEAFDKKLSQVEDLEAQLGAELGNTGVQTRSSRRMSSVMARTDLTMGHERNTFNDFGPGPIGRRSLNRNGRRGESTGSFTERQSFGARRRSSFTGYASVTSNGTSFLGVHPRPSSGDLELLNDLAELDQWQNNSDLADLPREVEFAKIKSIPSSTNIRSKEIVLENHFTVFTLPSPALSGASTDEVLSLCVMNRELQELTVVTFTFQNTIKQTQTEQMVRDHKSHFKAKDVRRASNIVDACKISDDNINRILILTNTRHGYANLHMESPWSAPSRLDLPPNLLIFDPYNISPVGNPNRRRETGLNRVIKANQIHPTGLRTIGTDGNFVVEDSEGKLHRVQVQMQPSSPEVAKILQICNLALPNCGNDSLRVAWWEAMNWLRARGEASDSEWTAIVIVLFALALPFLPDTGNHSNGVPRRKKTSLLRSGSGVAADLSNWNAMLEAQRLNPKLGFQTNTAWAWTIELSLPSSHYSSPSLLSHSRKPSLTSNTGSERNITTITTWVTLAREFLQSPAGETAIGTEGYLPTAMNQDRRIRQTALATVLVALHLGREERKLNTDISGTRAREHDLGPILAQLGHWLGWKSWSWREGTYYNSEIEDVEQWTFDDSSITGLQTPAEPFEPPSIFSFVEQCICGQQPQQFPTLLDVVGSSATDDLADSVRLLIFQLTPRSLSLLAVLSSLPALKSDKAILDSMLDHGLDESALQSLPEGVAAVFQRAISSKRSVPDSTSLSLLKLLGRDDLSASYSKAQTLSLTPRSHGHLGHESIRDHHGINSTALEADTVHSWDVFSDADRHTITRLIFSHDRRFQEASKLVNQTRPPVVECTPESEWSEAELLDAQKELVQHVTRRTLSVSAGRGMIHFNARVPLLTERVPIPAFSLQCVMKPRHGSEVSQAITFSADKAAFTEDKVCWAFFHNGAAAGLMMSKEAKGIDTSWIWYNKPPELTNRHAGFLLALGLNGHLKHLAKWVAFKYLTPKHTMTSIGLLLGLSASYLGTMDTLITRLLSVHVTRLLPPGAAELNLSALTQTSGIMGVGLVYLGSGHRRMSEVMVSEIENAEAEELGGGSVPSNPSAAPTNEESMLRDEGYRLAAGFSLGLINLGRGRRLDGLRDMNVLERLLNVAVGTKNVDIVNILDRATAGAVIAIALIWLKTGDESVARKIDIPDTLHQFDYVRPDIFLLRTLARHLILWDRIQPTAEFVRRNLPGPYQRRAGLRSIKHLSSEDMPFFNIVAGICFAIALRFAGSMNLAARDLLVAYLDQFIRLTRLPALNYDAKLTRNSLRHCQDLLALSVSSVMAGSGDLVVLRRLRSLHGRTDAETPYGSHLAAHMAIGALFLGGGTCTFGTSDVAVASLLISFYPIFPTTVLDNKAHLQALRHLWVLAVEQRCVVGREVTASGGRPVMVDMYLTMKEGGEERKITTPSLLPELDSVQKLEVRGGEYWDVSLDFTNSAVRERFQSNQSVWLKRRTAYDRPVGEAFLAELQALDEASEVPSVGLTRTDYASGSNKSPFDWLFALDAFRDLDQAERALLLPPSSWLSPPHAHGGAPVGDGWSPSLLKGSVVDDRLELERNVLPDEHSRHVVDDTSGAGAPGMTMNRDRLWQLRLLFAWVDRWDREQEEQQQQKEEAAAAAENEKKAELKISQPEWLKREVVDRLRWRVWRMTDGGGGGEMR